MALAALSGLGSAQPVPPGGPSSDQVKTHVFASNAAPQARLLPRNAGTEAAGTSDTSIAALRLATQQVEQAVRAQASSLRFSIEQSSGKTIVKVTDSETGEVLRQIPSDEMLSLPKAINNMQGLLLSQRA